MSKFDRLDVWAVIAFSTGAIVIIAAMVYFEGWL